MTYDKLFEGNREKLRSMAMLSGQGQFGTQLCETAGSKSFQPDGHNQWKLKAEPPGLQAAGLPGWSGGRLGAG